MPTPKPKFVLVYKANDVVPKAPAAICEKKELIVSDDLLGKNRKTSVVGNTRRKLVDENLLPSRKST
jgi:hypothetical protein